MISVLSVLKAASLASSLKMAKDVVPLVREAREWVKMRGTGPKKPKQNDASTSDETTPSLVELVERLERLEVDGDKHAVISAEIVTQIESLAQGLDRITVRFNILLVVSAAFGVLAIVALIFALLA